MYLLFPDTVSAKWPVLMHTGKTSCFFCVVVLVCLFLVTLSYFAVSLTSSHHIPDSSPPLGWTHACFLSSRGISTPTVFCARLGTACQGAGLHPKIPARTCFVFFFSPGFSTWNCKFLPTQSVSTDLLWSTYFQSTPNHHREVITTGWIETFSC